MIIVSALIAIYYAVIIAYCIYFFFASMAATVPWKDCSNAWNTCECDDGSQNFTLPDPWNGTRLDCCKYCDRLYETLCLCSVDWFSTHDKLKPVCINR